MLNFTEICVQHFAPMYHAIEKMKNVPLLTIKYRFEKIRQLCAENEHETLLIEINDYVKRVSSLIHAKAQKKTILSELEILQSRVRCTLGDHNRMISYSFNPDACMIHYNDSKLKTMIEE